jgi:hypothetical protein
MTHIDGCFVYGDDVYVDEYYFDERWAYIPGFPNYRVSDKGRVWSEKTQKFLKLKPLDDHGHLGVCLSRDGEPHYRYIHRLVAEAFIPNPNKHKIVRHLYDDPSQNEYGDLLWGEQIDNIRDSIRNGTAYRLTAEDRYLGNKDRMIPLVAINMSTGEKLYFESQAEAGRSLGVPASNIWKVMRGLRSSAGGYLFEEVRHD